MVTSDMSGEGKAFSIHRKIYGAAEQNFGDLYYPKITPKITPKSLPEISSEIPAAPPVVLLLHGGFWRAAYGLDLMMELAEVLAASGCAIWNVEYRRVGEEGGGWPGTLQDVAAAADYLSTLAREFPLDLGRVIPVGHSAGGHLAFWLAGQQKWPEGGPELVRPRYTCHAAVSLAGAIDLDLVWQLNLGHGAAAALLGGLPAEYPERYALASPAALLPLGVPQVLIHGTVDTNVPLEVSQHYAQKAEVTGDTIKLVTLPDVEHFAIIQPQTEAGATVVREVLSLTTM